MFSSLFSSLTNPRISPSAWDPTSTLPPGSTSIVETFTAPVGPTGAISLTADTGAWSHGTVVFKAKNANQEFGASPRVNIATGGSKLTLPGAFGGQAQSSSGPTTPTHEFSQPGGSGSGSGVGGARVDPDAPPSYEAIVASVPDTGPAPPQDVKARQLDDGEGLIEVKVEARWNDEKLWDEAKVDLVQVPGGGVDLIIQVSQPSRHPPPATADRPTFLTHVQTPNMTPGRLTSQLSFHVTFTFPSEMTRLARLTTRGSQWRTLGESSLGQLRIGEVDVSTANTLVEFKKLRAGKVALVTVNKEIKGDYEVDSLEAKTGNAAVEVNVAAVGNCSVVTSNR